MWAQHGKATNLPEKLAGVLNAATQELEIVGERQAVQGVILAEAAVASGAVEEVKRSLGILANMKDNLSGDIDNENPPNIFLNSRTTFRIPRLISSGPFGLFSQYCLDKTPPRHAVEQIIPSLCWLSIE